MVLARHSIITSGALSVALGWIYVANVPGLTSDTTPTTGLWGWWAIGLGLLLALTGWLGHWLTHA